MIHQIVNETNQKMHELRDNGDLTKKVLAVGIEINQEYLDYLDRMLDADHLVENGVTVQVDGKTIRFPDNESFASWLAENMT